MAEDLISVVIPTFNRADMLQRAVRQVTSQEYRPLQLIMVNDGSTDDTREVLEGLRGEVQEAEVAPVFVHKENGGVSSARNAGLREAAGAMIAFLDDDDTWQPDKLARQVKALRSSGADVCFGMFERDNGEEVVPMPATPDRLPQEGKPARYFQGEHGAHINSTLVTRAAAARVGDFDEDLRQYEDIEWITRLLCFSKVCHTAEVVGRYEFTPGSLYNGAVGLERLLERGKSAERFIDVVRERCKDYPCWEDAPWRKRVKKEYELMVKHHLYAGNLSEAQRLHDKGVELLGSRDPFKRLRAKMRKARLFALVGKRITHPRFARTKDITHG
jgi:glycosyltransferase involved in cell wall biosynthesis